MGKHNCLKCGGTGFWGKDQIPCDCGAYEEQIVLPITMNVPVQYQGVKFDSSFLKQNYQGEYGSYMTKLLRECTTNIQSFHKNILICSPPNTGKTIWAYTVYGMLYSQGVEIPDLKDLMEVRDIFMNYYTDDKEQLILYSTARLAIIKLPLDLPVKYPETMSTIIERRVRNNASTIFMYGGSLQDIKAQDRFGKFEALLGDGSYNSICAKSF